jgi:DNA-directed RNA polymerase subunit RPC12/RpoP
MHKENIRCTRCGKSETREINLEEVLKCFSCDEAIILKQAVTFGKRSDQEGAELSKLRDNLQRVILAEDDSSILKYSQDILTFIPNDYSALYYEAYVNNKSGQPKALHDFYESTNDEKTTKELENVVNHILTHFVLTHYNKANAFMKRESPQTCDELNRLYKERKQKEEDYAVVPRQVFICHKSEDFDVVRKSF